MVNVGFSALQLDAGKSFCQKYDLPVARAPVKEMIDGPSVMERVRKLSEEARETHEAAVKLFHISELDRNDANGLLAMVIDGLIDTTYVAAGLLHQLGVDAQEFWEEVHDKNMQKVRGPGHSVVKPEGFTPPDIIGILQRQQIRALLKIIDGVADAARKDLTQQLSEDDDA